MIKFLTNENVNNMTNYKITDNPFSKCLIYLENNEIIGFLDYSVIYEKIEINYIFVKEEYRNCHIATNLLNYMINDNLDKENITLEVNVNNIKAYNLYLKFGFKKVAIRKNYYQNQDAYLMERRIKWRYLL